MANWVDGYYQNVGWLKIPKTTVDGSGNPTGLTYLGQTIPLGGIALTDVWNAGGVRYDGTNYIDENSAIISGSPAVADQAALLALNAATYENFSVTVTSGLNRSTWTSNGTAFGPLNGQYIQEKSNTSVHNIVVPSAGLTWTAADNAGTVRLTTVANASHGLTTTPAVGAELFVTAGTGWTANSFHTITAVNDTSGVRTVDLSTAWASQSAPTVADAGDEITVKTINLPILRANSTVICEFNQGYSADAGGSSRRVKFYINSTNLNNNNFTSATNTQVPFKLGFKNLNSVSSQRGLVGENNTGYIGNTLAPLTAAVDTSVATTISIAYIPAAANCTMELQDYTVIIRG